MSGPINQLLTEIKDKFCGVVNPICRFFFLESPFGAIFTGITILGVIAANIPPARTSEISPAQYQTLMETKHTPEAQALLTTALNRGGWISKSEYTQIMASNLDNSGRIQERLRELSL